MIHMYVYTTFTHDSTCITVVYIRPKPWPAMSQPSEPRASLGGGSVDAAPLSLGGYGLQHPPPACVASKYWIFRYLMIFRLRIS